jgi:drug/metabolite transporter (DMT)-like permease
MIMKNKHLKADLWLLLATFFWGITFVAVKDSLKYSSPLAFLGIRFFIAGLVLLPFCYKSLKKLSRQGWKDGIILGVFLFAGFAFQTMGLVYTTATRSAFITGLCVALVPGLSAVMLKTKNEIWQILGVLLAAIGLYFLSRPEAGGFNTGDLLTAICAVSFAVEVVLVQKYTQKHSPMDMIMVQIITTVVLSALLIGFIEKPALQWSPNLFLGLAITSLLATAGALVIQFNYQRKTTATRAAVIYTMEPLFAALFAFLVIGEQLPKIGWIGAGLITAGMLTAELGK